MICTSIQNKSLKQIKRILSDPSIEMAEIRLDLCPIAVEEIHELFKSSQKPLIATCRFTSFSGNSKNFSNENAEKYLKNDACSSCAKVWFCSALERLNAAVEAGAMFADLELGIETPEGHSMAACKRMNEARGGNEKCRVYNARELEIKFTELCRKHGTRIIRSYHNFERTPGLATLKKKVKECFEAGADIAKIATTARSFKDTCTIDKLYDWFKSSHKNHEANSKHFELVAFTMGEVGRVSRVDCLMNGAPFTYASLNADECTAPGQLSIKELNGMIYSREYTSSDHECSESLSEGEKAIVSMFSLENIVQQKSGNRKELYLNKAYNSVPASKSYAQRAIIASSLAEGTSHIHNYTPCEDSEAAIEVARALGATISKKYTPIPYGSNINELQVKNEVSTKDGGSEFYHIHEPNEVCTLAIKGIGASSGTKLHLNELHTGESGLLTRLMVPILSILNDCNCRFTGKKTLIGRPLKGLKETMAELGIQVLVEKGKQDISIPFSVNVYRTSDSFAMSNSGDGDCSRIPALNYNCIHESGNVPAHPYQNPLRIAINGSNGSQIISGLMMALPLSRQDYEIIVENPKSVPYLRMTAQVLAEFGIQISILPEYNATCYNNSSSAFEFSEETLKINLIELSGSNTFSTAETMGTDSVLRIRIRGNQIYKAADYVLEGDWSGAANLLVAGAILGRAEVHGLKHDTLQGDSVILDILAKAGALVSVGPNKAQIDSSSPDNIHKYLQSYRNSQSGSIQPQYCVQNEAGHISNSATDIVSVVKAPLRAFNVSLENAPDLFPVVALLAAFCSGESRIEGAHRLVGKESNRAQAIVEMLRQMGVSVSLEDNTLIIKGESLSSRILNQRLPKGGAYSSHHDHRMAMALSIAKLCTRSIIEIDDTECIAKSFPSFVC